MNKTQLIAAAAQKAGVTQKDAGKVIDAAIEAVFEALKRESVQIVGFGTFEVRKRAAREGINPATGEKIKIAAFKVPAFKPGKAFKDAVK